METIQITSLAVAILNAAAGIWFGIRTIVRSNEDRWQQQDKATAQQREAEDRCHGEAMTQRRDAMAQQDRRREEVVAALKELIRQTAPSSGTGE